MCILGEEIREHMESWKIRQRKQETKKRWEIKLNSRISSGIISKILQM